MVMLLRFKTWTLMSRCSKLFFLKINAQSKKKKTYSVLTWITNVEGQWLKKLDETFGLVEIKPGNSNKIINTRTFCLVRFLLIYRGNTVTCDQKGQVMMKHYSWGAPHLLPSVTTLTIQWHLGVNNCISADVVLMDGPSELLICKPWSDAYKIYYFIKSMRNAAASMDHTGDDKT